MKLLSLLLACCRLQFATSFQVPPPGARLLEAPDRVRTAALPRTAAPLRMSDDVRCIESVSFHHRSIRFAHLSAYFLPQRTTHHRAAGAQLRPP